MFPKCLAIPWVTVAEHVGKLILYDTVAGEDEDVDNEDRPREEDDDD